MKRTRQRLAEAEVFPSGEAFVLPIPFPSTCSLICQCKKYFPCYVSKHNPCRIKIPFEQNHTHILIQESSNGIAEVRKVCVSPKCLGLYDGMPFTIPADLEFLQTPPIRCNKCYAERQSRKDSRLVIGSEADSSSLVWAWRKNIINS